MPYAMTPSNDDDSRRYQLWAEPQYLLPPFAAVSNAFRPLPINQLPKIWRYSTFVLLVRPDSLY